MVHLSTYRAHKVSQQKDLMCLSHCLCDVKGTDKCKEEAVKQEETRLANEHKANLNKCMLNCKAEVWYTGTTNRGLFTYVVTPQNAGAQHAG